MITLTAPRQIGPALRRIRKQCGITVNQLVVGSFLTRSCVYRRESTGAISSASLIDHAHVLGFDLALIPQRHPGARPTGTGWPT